MRRSLDKKSPAGDAGLLLFIDGRELPAECHFDRREKSCPTVREKISRRVAARNDITKPMSHTYYVYLLTNWNDKVMYVGVTNDLKRRIHEHKTKAVKGFTAKYNVHKLVYFEATTDVRVAIAREKEIKKWRRQKKNALVQSMNPEWKDLSKDWFE